MTDIIDMVSYKYSFESARFRRSAVSILALGMALLVALSVSVARAEPPKLIPYGSFEPGNAPIGVAVDQPSGDVFVAGLSESGGPSLDKFDASGDELLAPSPFGAKEEFVNAGAAVNPANGDLYVYSQGTIDTYDPSTGDLLPPPASFPVPPSFNAHISRELPAFLFPYIQIGVNSAGDVYVPVIAENEVQEYSPAGVLLNTIAGGSGGGALNEPSGVAVDAAGDLWVADTGNNRIEELSPTGTPITTIGSEGVLWVALDGHGDVFALAKNSKDSCGHRQPPCSHLLEYDAAGAQVADVGAGVFEADAGTGEDVLPPMVAVDEASGRVYVTDNFDEKVWIFGPPKPPAVGKELVAEVDTSEVKLGALVNPGGTATSYRFEYGTSTAYGQSTPFPEGSVGESLNSRTVWAAASGLAPGTTYHYRIVATNELGTVDGPDQTFTTLTALETRCENEQLRGGFSSRLPDCRAYELVIGPAKNSAQVRAVEGLAGDGNALSWSVNEPLPGAPTGGVDYVAMRGAEGWSSQDVIPIESYTGVVCPERSSAALAYSVDLSTAVVSYGSDTRGSDGKATDEECNAEGLQVVPGEPVGYENLLVRDNTTGTYRLVNAPPAGVTPADAHFEGASADLSHVVFSEMAPLTVGAPYGVENLYEWDEGVLHLIGTSGSLPEARKGANVVSADGSHVLFTEGGGLYVRIDGQRTVQVDEVQRGSGANGGGTLQAASADGSKIFFLDENKLTASSTAEAGQPDLYECALPEGASKCQLTDITVAKNGHADVLEADTLGSDDSSHVYFVAKGVLASNTREYTDSEGKTVVEGAQAGQQNVYMWDNGTTVFVARLGEHDPGEGRVSPDGNWFAFDSTRSLTGYDNTPLGGSPASEIFLYSAASNQLACVSCNPSGEAPIPNAGSSSFGGAYINEAPGESEGKSGLFPVVRPLSDGGRVFFGTFEGLVPADTNSEPDVYEYENGHLYLISAGTSASPSRLIGASENGNDVFFTSNQQLLPQDTEEGAIVVYDARVDGGFPSSSGAVPCATADACRAPASQQPGIYGAPSSQTFAGTGNPGPAPVAGSSKTPVLTRAQRLARALKVCQRDRSRRKRASCQASARKRYGAKQVKTKPKSRRRRK